VLSDSASRAISKPFRNYLPLYPPGSTIRPSPGQPVTVAVRLNHPLDTPACLAWASSSPKMDRISLAAAVALSDRHGCRAMGCFVAPRMPLLRRP